MKEIAPSMLSADFSNIKGDIEILNKNEIKFIHLDVMDGNFVPNISFGFPVIKAMRKYTDAIFDVHLMIDTPSRYIKEFAESGADYIVFHIEAENHIDRAIKLVKECGKKVGIALNPATPVSLIKGYIHLLDMVLVMSVNPGFGGQSFIEYTKDKIKELNDTRKEKNLDFLIEIDGGIDENNIKEISELGCNVFVAGSSVFKNRELDKNIKALNEKIK